MGTLKYINLYYYTFSTCQIYHTWIVHEHKCLSSFLFFRFPSFFKLREKERVYKIGYKEKQSQSYLSYLDGFLWRIFLLSRADRLYAIFSTGLKKWLLRVQDILFVVFYPEYLALVPSAMNPVQQLIFLLSISADGKESPLPFWGPSQSFGFSLLPSHVKRPEWGHQVQTSGLHCDPHSFLTVILCRLATVNSNTRIVVIIFLSSQWDTTWQLAYFICFLSYSIMANRNRYEVAQVSTHIS